MRGVPKSAFVFATMDNDFVPGRFATPQLMWHILKKGWQAGSVLGVGLVAPIAAARMYRSGSRVDHERLLTLLAYSAATGVGLTGEILSVVITDPSRDMNKLWILDSWILWGENRLATNNEWIRDFVFVLFVNGHSGCWCLWSHLCLCMCF